MFMAEAFWGLMSPITKDALMHGITGIDLVTYRVIGAAILFWVASLFVKREHVPVKDILMFALACIFGLCCNQCLFTIGLTFTSPVNASIMTTSMPIFAMIFAFLILHEPLSTKKVSGVLIGCMGAVMLVLTSAAAHNAKVGDIRGDLMIVGAQCSFALYLSLFNSLVKRYHPVTVNKWMFLWASLFITPFTFSHVAAVDYAALPASTIWETVYIVCVGTFFCYLLMMNGQKILRPTVVSIYNNVQPIVSVIVSIAMGLCIFKITQLLAVILVFIGVMMVTKSKSKRDLAQKAS